MISHSFAWVFSGVWSVGSGMVVALTLGQVNPSDVHTWTAPLTAMTSVGFAVWFGWYTQTKTLPDKDKYHADLERLQREQFQSDLKLQRDDCRNEREHNTANIERLAASIDRISDLVQKQLAN